MWRKRRLHSRRVIWKIWLDFFDIQISHELSDIIEKSGIMEGVLGYRIAEQMKNFIGHYLESKGSNVRIKKIEYG